MSRTPSTAPLEMLLDALEAASGPLQDELADKLAEILARRQAHSRLVDASTMAPALGVHPDTLVRWAREGRIWATKVGREWRFRPDRPEIEAVSRTPGRERPEPARRRQVARSSIAAIRGPA